MSIDCFSDEFSGDHPPGISAVQSSDEFFGERVPVMSIDRFSGALYEVRTSFPENIRLASVRVKIRTSFLEISVPCQYGSPAKSTGAGIDQNLDEFSEKCWS